MWTKAECEEAWVLLEAALKGRQLPVSTGCTREVPVGEFKIAERTSGCGYHFVHYPSGSHVWVYRWATAADSRHGIPAHEKGDLEYFNPPNRLFGGFFNS